MTDELMTAAQAPTLKQLAQDAYELDAFKPNLTRPEADKRIAMLTAKLKLLDGPAAYPLRRRPLCAAYAPRRSLRNPFRCGCHVLEYRSACPRRMSLACLR
jgi:hypothetical protein